ncbi:Maintenance of ploidy protein mob2 [Tulasnella sp. JGI-2019a]|nr:Maintenance of ploidy protein mob2 [Tulasnella sp. JGI-2019a]KAG9003696.1 Maintenance of ploidy protein mob2 [Tulasnella sp. JGI-2019a]KAG9026383.1 Maintenance of ploidy protein mob2 [Tulasnella sp. JGI-2019a]
MSFLGSLGRSMTRGSRPTKTSPRPQDALSPTSETSSQGGALSPISPTSSYNGNTLTGRAGTSPRRSPLPSPENSSDNQPPPLYMSQPFVKASLVKGNFKLIVMQPKWVDINEWVAINIYEFYNNLNMFYGVLSEFCTADSCPTMAAGKTLDYTWIDSNRKQIKLAAPIYVDYVFTWVQNLLEDKNVFPTDSGRPFPSNFASTAKHIYRQLLRVFAHIFHSHFTHMLHLHSEAHLNSLFAHFLAFGTEYELLDAKDIRGQPGHTVGVGELWDKWKENGVITERQQPQ